ncbi:SCO family protein [Lysobacter sp. KIS68-7]|uniref:SCO family protein n=1 Tax=Lysobacter sp. KIS68-7 TaxID=2904252 RepID=UPI001E4F43B4|nr:SCO family protein [Lysobacter sp. KIS68-7]UHQ20069.1 SCO family protein [Lysobacter sp. KIS68-7]
MKRMNAVVAALLLFGATTLALAAKPAPLPSDSVYRLALPLTDAQGKKNDWSQLRGKPRVVAMFYTSCPYMCPLIVEGGKAVEHALSPAERAKVGVVLISLDPKHDTPEKLRAMAAERHVDPTQWTLAAPAPDDVRKVAGVLGVRYRELADGNFNHTSALVLLDADGRIVARTEQVGAKPDPAFVEAVRKQL